ncbi:hypothetical protein AB4622_01920 [Vibrio splendidus]
MFNFDVFSRREKKHKTEKKKLKALTKEFRNRFFMLINDQYLGVSMEQVLTETRSMMMMCLGKAIGTPQRGHFHNDSQDMMEFMWSCEDGHFFDAMEYMFQTRAGGVLIQREDFVDRINQLFDLDELPYKLTYGKVERFEVEDKDTDDNHITSFGTAFQLEYTYPKVIRKDSETINHTAIEPVLTLLRSKEFSAANQEFMAGLEDYRHGKYRDSVTKCCSAFESVMKVVCKQRKIKLKGNETVGPLISKLIADTNLPTFFDQPLMIVGTIRNKLGIAHGSGEEEKHVSENIALYSINATASAILLVTGE